MVHPVVYLVLSFQSTLNQVDEAGEFTGDDIAYLYPDLELALLGSFSRGLLVSGREVDVAAHRRVDGGMNLECSPPRGPRFRYRPPDRDSFGDQPGERDPLDKKYLYLAPSRDLPLAGEGAWAARDVAAGTTVGQASSTVVDRLVRVFALTYFKGGF